MVIREGVDKIRRWFDKSINPERANIEAGMSPIWKLGPITENLDRFREMARSDLSDLNVNFSSVVLPGLDIGKNLGNAMRILGFQKLRKHVLKLDALIAECPNSRKLLACRAKIIALLEDGSIWMVGASLPYPYELKNTIIDRKVVPLDGRSGGVDLSTLRILNQGDQEGALNG